MQSETGQDHNFRSLKQDKHLPDLTLAGRTVKRTTRDVRQTLTTTTTKQCGSDYSKRLSYTNCGRFARI